MSENITAFTAPGTTYPPYVSINERGVLVEITVRSPATQEGNCGPTASMTMTRADFEKLLDDARVWFAGKVDLS